MEDKKGEEYGERLEGSLLKLLLLGFLCDGEKHTNEFPIFLLSENEREPQS